MSGRDPLINVPAEAIVLGGMMLDNRLIAEFSDRMKAEDFAEPLHQRIFSAMLRFAAKGAKATAVSMRPVFAMDPDAEGGAYLDQLIDNPAASHGAEDLGGQVIELAARRRGRDAMRSGIETIENVDVALGDAIGGVEERMWAAERDDDDSELLSMGDLTRLVRKRQERITSGEQTAGAMNALVTDLDTLLGALERKTYTILAGRPGMGKTTVASSAAIGWAINGNPGLYLGTEMDEEQHGMRVVSDLSYALGRGIEHDIIKSGKLSPGDLHWIDQVAAKAEMLPLRYKKIGACSWRRVYSIVAREKARLKALGKELFFVVVDYMGMLQAESADGKPIEDNYKRMSAVSAGMMRIRDELGVAVFALAQLSRDVDKRDDKRPHNADLKDTGNLEQDADAVLFAYREEYYLENSKPKAAKRGEKLESLLEEWEAEYFASRDKLDLICGKNRHGQRRTKTVKFLGKYYAVRSGSHSDMDAMDDLPF